MDINLVSKHQNLLFFGCGSFLDIGTCFSQQYVWSEQPGDSWAPETVLSHRTSLSCGIYLRNVSIVPGGIRTSHLWWCFVVNASLLPCITAPSSQCSLHPQFAFKIFSQGLHLKKPKLKQNKTISHLSGGSSASLNKVNQPCVYFPGRNHVNKAAVIDVDNKSYGNTPTFCALLPPMFSTPGLFNQAF